MKKSVTQAPVVALGSLSAHSTRLENGDCVPFCFLFAELSVMYGTDRRSIVIVQCVNDLECATELEPL
jgi:hypothetical protein